MAIIKLPDGYNGHTEVFDTTPVEVYGDLVKLRCATPGKEYLIRWVLKSDVDAQKQKAEIARIRKNKARRERDQVMRDCGLVRVRGALGGVYWE